MYIGNEGYTRDTLLIDNVKNFIWNDLQLSTKLHPRLPQTFVKVIRNITSQYLQQISNLTATLRNEIRSKVKMLLGEMGTALLFDSLRKCNRTAAILPEQRCKLLAGTLRREHRHVFIGSEIYSGNIAVGFVLWRWVPKHILIRIKRIQSSGLWEWWATFAKEALVENSKNSPQPASMKGNIAVVFTLCLSGLFVSIVVFIMETLYEKLSSMTADLFHK